MPSRIAITGYGIISALGCGKAETLASLAEGRSGVALPRFLKTGLGDCPVGEVKLSDEELAARAGLPSAKGYGRTALLGILAAGEALEAAGLDGGAVGKAALISGTTVGGMDLTERDYAGLLAGTSQDSARMKTHDCGSSTDMISEHFGGFAMASTLSTACSSAANAMIFAAALIESGRFDTVVAGGSECLTDYHLRGFNSLMIVDREPCRPFDISRAGLNLGEGAAYLVLEREEAAAARGARPLAWLSGYGNACDAFHQTATSENGEGAFLAMGKALSKAGLKPSDIDYVNAHGTATPDNDAGESAALRRIYGDSVPPVSSTKPLTGHTTSASGSIESIICIMAMQEGFIPASKGFATPDPGCVIPVSETMRGVDLRHIMCNSFGFGGNDSSLIISKCGL